MDNKKFISIINITIYGIKIIFNSIILTQYLKSSNKCKY